MEIINLICNTKKDSEIKIFFIGDTHLHNINHDRKALNSAIKIILDTSKKYQTYVFLLGDLGDFIINSLDPRFSPVEIDRDLTLHSLKNLANLCVGSIVEIFKPIQHLIVASCVGNHEEAYIKRHAFDVYNEYCKQLNIFKLGAIGACKINFRFENHQGCGYDMMLAHGSGRSCSEPGAAIKKCKELMSRHFVDLCVMAHLHKMEDCKDSFNVINRVGNDVVEKDRFFAVTGCFVRKYVKGNRGYGELYGGKNTDIGMMCANLSFIENNKPHYFKIQTRLEKVYL